MKLCGRSRADQVEGEIEYFGLSKWWLTEFTEDERKYIEAKFQPLSIEFSVETGPRLGNTVGSSLTRGKIEESSGTAGGLLSALAGWFKAPGDRSLGRKMLAKAEELSQDLLDLHFTYLGMIEVYYRDRDHEPGMLEEAIRACEKQISIAPRAAAQFRAEFSHELPAHTGFHQLAIIREKAGDFEEAVRLSQEASEMGWAGD
jgi:hypothetical protein